MARRSGIRIKPANKGKLHAALGIPPGKKIPVTQLEAAKESPSPAMRKMANFALSARKWNKSGSKGRRKKG